MKANFQRKVNPQSRVGQLREACLLAFALCFAQCLVLSFSLTADAQLSQSSKINAQLKSGEFASAIASANSIADDAAKSEALQQIAIAQSNTGNRNAAINTLRQIPITSLQSYGLVDLLSQGTQQDSKFQNSNFGGHGGGPQPDFEPLMDLIQSTVAAESWDEVGGPGAIDSFVGGVYVEPSGLLKRISLDKTGALNFLHQGYESSSRKAKFNSARSTSNLRYISLTRLEREVLYRRAAGLPITDAMQTLAGLRRIQYVLVYPKTNELVIAGPASDWTSDKEGRIVSTEDQLPVVRLNDFVTLWRREKFQGAGKFGCSIDPSQQSLAKAQEFLSNSTLKPLKRSQRKNWLSELQQSVGHQNIRFFGIENNTRVARILLEADYRMKLIGMGIEDGVPGVESYLNSIQVRAGKPLPAMNVLRWWFTLNYNTVTTNVDRSSFELHGPGLMVKSESELLGAQGNRIHTGKSDDLNLQFANSFSKHIKMLSRKYPIYGELRNVFDTALVVALIESEKLDEKSNWSGEGFLNDSIYPIEKASVPREVQTVINHRIINQRSAKKRHFIAGVSGGVSVDMRKISRPKAIRVEGYVAAPKTRETPPNNLNRTSWWWD